MPTTTTLYRTPVLPDDATPPTPREIVMRIERRAPPLPGGDEERLVGYGVIGLAFASGHVLGLRRWTASSVGPAYTSLWHRTPGGTWAFYADVAPELACTRYAGAAVDEAHTAHIRLAWTGPRTLVVEVPAAAIRWTMTLRDTAATRLFGAVRRRLPDRWLASERALAVLGACARVGLGTGPVRLAGRMPNGQRFRVTPTGLWVVDAARAEVRGEDVGAPGVNGPPARIGDFLIPRRPLFALATARFDSFDPSRHLAATSRAVGAEVME
jgi:hypothetical protein